MSRTKKAFELLAAGIIDLLFCSVVFGILTFYLLLELNFTAYVIQECLSVLLIPLYFIISTWFLKGKTIGKRLFKYSIAPEKGSDLSLSHALKRDGILLIPAILYLIYHLPYIDNVYRVYEAAMTDNYQEIGGFVIQSKMSEILTTIVSWSGYTWVIIEFLSILAHIDKKSIHENLSDTETIKKGQ